MSLEVMAAVLAAAFLHATWNAIAKASSGKAGDALAVGTGAGLLAGAAVPFLPLPAPACWPQLVASGILHLGYFKLVQMAYRSGDLSTAYPLMRGVPPLITALGAWLVLGEPLPVAAWVAIAVIAAGALVLAGDGLHARGLHGRTLRIVAANIVVIVAYTLVDGSGVRASGHALSYIAWMFLLTAASLIVARPWVPWHALPQSGRGWGLLVAGAVCTVGSYGIALWAMTRAPIGLVAALRETSILFGTLIAATWLGERVTPRRWLAVTMIAAGAALTRTA